MKKTREEVTAWDWIIFPTIAASCTSKRKWVRVLGVFLVVPSFPLSVVMFLLGFVVAVSWLVLTSLYTLWEEI